MTRNEQHSRDVWEEFWNKQDIDQVYGNSGRIIEQIERIGNVRGKWIMEIGAGSGRDGFRLVDLGANVILLDYATSSLAVIRDLADRLGKQVYLVRADAFALPFKSESIDIIFHQGLLEHFKKPEGILQQSYFVTKNGGHHVADVPQRYHIYTVVKHLLIWMNKWFAGWETEFSIGQLKQLFKRVGFDVYETYGDWMRPSFIYRAVREVLKKAGLVLPQYPKPVALFAKIRRSLRRFMKRQSISYYTFMDIGVVGMKKE